MSALMKRLTKSKTSKQNDPSNTNPTMSDDDTDSINMEDLEEEEDITDERVIKLNNETFMDEQGFPLNRVRTTKYTILTFLPINLFEQFHRYANIYFLIIAVLNWMPFISVFRREITFLPLTFVLTVTAVKDAYEDFRRYRMDKEVNNARACVYRDGEQVEVFWKDLKVGQVVHLEEDEMIPADILLLQCSDPSGNAYIETANLDGETNLKQRMIVKCPTLAGVNNPNELVGEVICDKPHISIYDYNGQFRATDDHLKVPIDGKNLMLRGCNLRNTDWALGVVVYTGPETKAMLNNTGPRFKRSKIERDMNGEIVWLAIILVVMCTSCAIAGGLWMDALPYKETMFIPFKDGDPEPLLYTFLAFWSNIILFNVMVPISLYVTLELIKLGQVYFMSNDPQMKDPRSGKNMQCRALNINEDLGQIEYIFSDKTGTLTENQMVFKKCSIGCTDYGYVDSEAKISEAADDNPTGIVLKDPNLVLKLSSCATDSDLYQFFLCLAICNTVVPRPGKDGSVRYDSESPDEAALVDAAKAYGFELVTRTQTSVTIRALGVIRTFKIMNVLEFTSTRKCMSIIIENPDQSITMYSKGADSRIYELLDQQNNASLMASTNVHLTQFSSGGLRTLCLAKKDLDLSWYHKWQKKWGQAGCALHDRQVRLDKLSTKVERGLTLLGATGIEDKLQAGVPEAIRTLREAGIHVWVLTGDKQETALEIAYSSKLIDEDMGQYVINGESMNEVRHLLRQTVETITRSDTRETMEKQQKKPKGMTRQVSLDTVEFDASPESFTRKTQHAMVIDGKSLSYALDETCQELFVTAACLCDVVLCARTAPLQKARVVTSVNQYKDIMSLAIGDGANDVSMIQCADVGVGVQGNEGMQAVMASDFAIGRFRFLPRLLLVHGHWNYHRIANTVLYFFFKNSIFVYLLLWYQFCCGFSGQTSINQYYLMTYNLLFTSLPIILFAILDQDASEDLLLKNPFLYYVGQKRSIYSRRWFWSTMLNAVWASLAIFFTTYLTYRDTEIGIWEFGTIMNTAMVVVVNVQLAMVSKNITWLNGLVLVGSVLAMFVFMFVFAVVPTELYYVAFVTVSDCRYWFIVLLASWLALFPQLVGQYLWQNELSGPLDRLRAKERTEHETRHDKERFQNAVAREPLPMATIDQSEKKKEVYGAEYPAYSRTPSALMSVPITLSSTSLASNGGV